MKKTRKILAAGISAIIAIAMIMAFCVPVFAADPASGSSGPSTPPPRDPNSEYVPPDDPKVKISSITNKIFQAGDTLMLPMVVDVAKGEAKDVRMRFSPETSGGAGATGNTGAAQNYFSFYSSTGWASIGKEISGKTSVRPYIQINPSTPDGTYTAKIEFEYTCEATTFTSTDIVILTIHGKSTTVLKVDSATFTKEFIDKDNKSPMVVKVSNLAPQSYRNVSISLDAANSKGFSLYENYSPVNLGIIKSGGTVDANFSVYVDTATINGNYPLSFDITYTDGTGGIVATKAVVPIQVNRPEEKKKEEEPKASVPRIIISNYKIDVEEIQAGQPFTLDFTLKNASAKVPVSNIKVVLSATTTSGTGTGATSSEVFFPASGSNSFYIPSIAPGATISNTIKLMSKQDVEPGVYSVQLKLDYEDNKGNAIPTATEQIAFPVIQEQRLEIQSMNIPTVGSAGSAIPINFQYINKGKATIYNLSVTVEGDFTMEGGSTYVGNLTAGYNDYFDSAVTPTKEGALKGTIVLKYEDASGGQKDKRTDFTVNVSAGSAPGMNMSDGTFMGDGTIDSSGVMTDPTAMPKKGLSPIVIVAISVVALIVVALLIVIIIKKKKAKKARVRDEED